MKGCSTGVEVNSLERIDQRPSQQIQHSIWGSGVGGLDIDMKKAQEVLALLYCQALVLGIVGLNLI